MLYLRNTNQQQTIERSPKGNAPERPWSAFSSSYYATPTYTTGALSIVNDQTTISTLNTSGSTFNARISASNDVTINLSGSLTNLALTGSFTMSLFVTSSDYSYNTTVYSAGALSVSLQAASASVYNITGSLTYNSSGTYATCSYFWVKAGETASPTNVLTASYIPCGTSSSVNMYFTSSLATASLGCVLDISGAVITPEVPPSGRSQVFQSPYRCDFRYPTGSSAGNRLIRFETPITGPSNPDSNYYLASWVPVTTDTYQFQILQPGQTLEVCTADINSAFFSKGSDVKYDKNYIINLDSC